MKLKKVLKGVAAVALSGVLAFAAYFVFLPSAALDQRGCHSAAYNASEKDALAFRATFLRDGAAAYRLYLMYWEGQELNEAKADAYLLKAAELGYAEAERRVAAGIYAHYWHPIPDKPREMTCEGHQDEFIKWMTRAAEHGNAAAQTDLAFYYQTGVCGFPQDPDAEDKWRKRGKESGDRLWYFEQDLKSKTFAAVAEHGGTSEGGYAWPPILQRFNSHGAKEDTKFSYSLDNGKLTSGVVSTDIFSTYAAEKGIEHFSPATKKCCSLNITCLEESRD